MKSVKIVFLFLLFAIISNQTFSQIIPNGGFEKWDTTGVFSEPSGYSTSNLYVYSQSGQPNVSRQNNAGSKDYSVWIESVNVMIMYPTMGYMMLGKPDKFLITGNIEDIEGGFPYTQVPDSFTFHAAHQCIYGDTAYVIVILKKNIDGISTPISTNTYKLIGIQRDFARFSFPVNKPASALTPDTAIICFTSSNPVFPDSTNNSNWIEIDKIAFILNGGTADPIPNSDFDNWEDTAGVEPFGWITNNFLDLAFMYQAQSVVPYSPGHSGKFAARIISNAYYGILPADTMGMLYMGVLTDNGSGLPIDKYPDSISFWYKYNNEHNNLDSGFVYVLFSKYDPESNTRITLDSQAIKLEPASTFSYKCISYAEAGTIMPDTFSITFSSSKLTPTGRGVGNYIILDDVVMWKEKVGIDPAGYQNKNCRIFPNPAQNAINLEFKMDAWGKNVVSIYNMQGKMIQSKEITSGAGNQNFLIEIEDFPSGQYIIKVSKSDLIQFSGSFIKAR